MSIAVDRTLQETGLDLHLGVLSYPVTRDPATELLADAIHEAARQRRQELMGEAAESDPVIAAVREAFKAVGQDPDRIRPSSERLTRLVLAGKPLPRATPAQDVASAVSLLTGIPVGAYDRAALKGDLRLRFGLAGERHDVESASHALEDMILLADDLGPLGGPYGDAPRAEVKTETRDVLLVLYGLNMDVTLVEAAAELTDMLMMRCAADVQRMDQEDMGA